MNLRIYLVIITLLVFSLSACQPTDSIITIKADNAIVMQAAEAEKAGDNLNAAQLYLSLATSTTGQQQAYYFLQAALAFWRGNDFEQASISLGQINRQQLSTTQQLDAAILEADIALINSQAEQALAALSGFDLQQANDLQKARILKLKIRAYEITENWLEKANTHIKLAPLLANQDQEQNQQALWHSLTSLTPQALDLFNPGIPPAIDSGWFALAYAVQSYQNNPDALIVALEDWQRNYPNHPADPLLYKKSLETGTQLPQQLNAVVILLPNTGPYSSAAAAIKEGIIAAHYTQGSNTKLHFFDVSTDSNTGTSNVWQHYQRAIDLNANLVIGPLDKESIQILADAETLPIPVLALNRLSTTTQSKNLFQFGLAPEDDAISAANYAITQGFQRALVLAPTSEWGDRVASTFSEQWLKNGGVLLSRADYTETENDFSSVITPLLALEASKQRYQSLKQTLATSAEFEPRRRQDVDFIFLVARPSKARQLLPQLQFHRSGNLPIIATSHAYTGSQNSQQDIDLNDLIINDIPWIFKEIAQSDPTYRALYESQSESFDRSARLYALGADAYRLISELNGLSRSSTLTISGATGLLSINALGHINRDTLWAKFSAGKLKLLPSVTNTTNE